MLKIVAGLVASLRTRLCSRSSDPVRVAATTPEPEPVTTCEVVPSWQEIFPLGFAEETEPRAESAEPVRVLAHPCLAVTVLGDDCKSPALRMGRGRYASACRWHATPQERAASLAARRRTAHPKPAA